MKRIVPRALSLLLALSLLAALAVPALASEARAGETVSAASRERLSSRDSALGKIRFIGFLHTCPG